MPEAKNKEQEQQEQGDWKTHSEWVALLEAYQAAQKEYWAAVDAETAALERYRVAKEAYEAAGRAVVERDKAAWLARDRAK